MAISEIEKKTLLVFGMIPRSIRNALDPFELIQYADMHTLEEDNKLENFSAVILIDDGSTVEEFGPMLLEKNYKPVIIYSHQGGKWLRLIDNGVQDILALSVSVDHKMHIEKAIRRHTRELALRHDEAQQELFISRLIHDIRSPLSTIVSTVKLHLEEKQTCDSALQTIDRASRYLLKLVNHTLDIAKIKSGQIHLKAINFRFLEVVEEIEAILKPKFTERDITLVRSVSGDVNVDLEGDPDRLGQILMNLLANAIKFSNFHSRIFIDISAEKSDSHVLFLVKVKDEGVGISENDFDRIFENYEQIKNTESGFSEGTGLGLGIVKSTIEAMNGSIEVQSEIGKGATFAVKIPFKRASDTNQPTILIVDQESNFSDYMKVFFKDEGFQLKETETLQEALNSLSSESIDFILTDLPSNTTGKSKMIQNLQRRAEVPVAVVSGLLTDQDKVNFRKQGIESFNNTEDFTGSLLEYFKSRTQGPGNQRSLKERPKPRESIFSKPLRLLVADDGEDVKLLIKMYLKGTSFVVDFVSDGLEAIDLSRQSKYDLIFLDIHMPKVDGFEALKQVSLNQNKLFSSHPPIVAMTAATLGNDINRCYDAGFVSHLSKPFEKQETLDLIESLLDDGSLKEVGS